MTAYREPLPEGMKRCGRCHQVKPAEDFHRNRSTYDGLQAYCKECQCEVSQQSKKQAKEYHLRRLNLAIKGE